MKTCSNCDTLIENNEAICPCCGKEITIKEENL